MAENEPNEARELNTEEWDIGFTHRGQMMIVSLPLRMWAEDEKHGDILVSGLFAKAERIALRNLTVMRAERKDAGIIAPPPGMAGRPN